MSEHRDTTPPTSAAIGQGPLLVLGPLLRYVDATRATVWVETDRPCEVEVLGHRERTWEVHGHHYALVVVEGLEPGTSTSYEVHLDEHRAWPEPGSPLPPSVIRTPADDEHVRLAFGSCRRAAGFDRSSLRLVGADAMAALAGRMTGGEQDAWPDALLLVGDQVYADDPSPALRERLERLHQTGDQRDESDDVAGEIVTFEEYTWLYHESWRSPQVRWLLSTVQSCMILDDHDLRDDWNSSLSWREQVEATSWFKDRVQGALSSYWVYQHLGNLSPDELAKEPVYRAVREAPDTAVRERILAHFSWTADQEPDSARWSFVRDFGRTRLVVVDSRCARHLDPGDRRLVDRTEWAWLQQQVDADVDHLLLGTSLPVLMLHGLHHLEGLDEALAEGAKGPLGERVGEKLRLALDLEDWAAFRNSFDEMVELVHDVGTRPSAPASVLWLSGDVHCSYLATAHLPGVDGTSVHQLTMSPFRNPLEPWVRVANRWFERRGLARTLERLARWAGVRDPDITWDVPAGPWFDNGVMTVAVSGRDAAVEVEHARVVEGAQVLDRTATLPLTTRRRDPVRT